MSPVVRLALAAARARPVRVLLTAAATAAAVCLVVWVASGYDALARSIDHYSSKALGRYPLSVGPISEAPGLSLSPDVLEALVAAPEVAAVEPMWVQRVELEAPAAGRSPGSGAYGRGLAFAGSGDPGGPPGQGAPVLLGIDAVEPPFPLVAGRWLAGGDEAEVGLAARAAERLGLAPGDELTLGQGEGGRRAALRVVGVIDAPEVVHSGRTLTTARVLVPAMGELFVRRRVAGGVLGRAPEVSFVAVSLAPGADLTRFRFGLAPRLGRCAVPAQFQEAHEVEEALDETATTDNVRLQSYAATGIALLVALLVVCTTLNMGVSERVRELAIARAVVLTRGGVATLIALEGLLPATLGLMTGLAAGALLLATTARAADEVLHHGAPLGPRSLALAAVVAFGGALLGAVIPAWRAMRVRPLDALAAGSRGAGAQALPRRVVVCGLVLVGVFPALIFAFPPGRDDDVLPRAVVGLGASTLGFVLLTPAVVFLLDRWLSPVLARLLRIEPRLLASQLTSNLWRTVGASLALSVGLGLFVSIQVWGFTMLQGFVPGAWTPDALVAFGPDGIDPAVAARLREAPEVDPTRCYPLVVEQPRLKDDLTGSAEQATVTRQDNVVIAGLDPQAIAGPEPLLRLEWVAGTPEQALAALERGRACVVPDHFLRETGLRVGDGFDLVPPERPDHPVRYVIAGAVRLPGWHWQTKHTGFRLRSRRAAALVFADYASVARDFDRPRASHVWLSYARPDVAPEAIGAAARGLYAEVVGPGRDVTVRTEPGEDEPGPFARVMTVAGVRQVLDVAATRWLWLISQVPLVAVLVACLGVLNVVLASVRARRWDLGVLRALGFERGVLVRAVIAEGVLIGAVAAVVSLAFGVHTGWCGAGAAQYVSFFGGMHPDLVVPWLPLALGIGVTIALSALAAAWPAASLARAGPLDLLQDGRGAF